MQFQSISPNRSRPARRRERPLDNPERDEFDGAYQRSEGLSDVDPKRREAP